MIEVNGLTKTYGEITALRDVTFEVKKGQIVGFLGANGAGKTTTMDILCGCTGADNGVAKVCGIDITEEPEAAKKHLGYLPDEPPLYNEMRVREYIQFAAAINCVPKKAIAGRVDDVISRLSLGEVAGRLVGNLSKGFRQRVGLAQAIVHDPDVLVLDEPTEGLDPNQIVQIRELIKSLAGQHTILLSSHILSEVQNTCDHIIIIHEGRIVKQGTYDEIVKSAATGNHFRVTVRRNVAKLADDLRSSGRVASVDIVAADANRLEVNVNNPETDTDEIVKKILGGNYGLVEFAPKTRSLEQVFYQLTH